MSTNLALVKAYLDTFMSGRTEEFRRQIAPTFRYDFLPPEYGEGPDQVIRWREFSFSVYRKWQWIITDAFETGAQVVVWLNFIGTDPSEADTISRYESSVLLRFEIAGGLIASCSGLNPALEGHIETGDADGGAVTSR